MRYRDILSEVLVVRSTESNDTLLGLSSIVIDISTDKHSVLWKTFRTLDNPEIVSAFNMHLLKDIRDNRFVETPVTSSSDSIFKNNLGENSNILQRNLFNFLVILHFFVVKEDKDYLWNLFVLSNNVSDHFADLQSTVFRIPLCDYWFVDMNT